MTFIWPTALLLLVVVAGLAVLYVLAQRRRNRYALRYANQSLVREAIGKGPGWRRHVPPVLFILALAFMAIAVARAARSSRAVITITRGRGEMAHMRARISRPVTPSIQTSVTTTDTG